MSEVVDLANTQRCDDTVQHNASGPSGGGFWNDMDVLEVGNGEFDCTTPESIDRAKAQ